jgi:hypothetical protein
MLSINPETGDDSQCGASFTNGISCKTIAHAVSLNMAAVLTLETGIYSEPTIFIINVTSLDITGVSNTTVVDCSRRLAPAGPAFSIVDSAVTIRGVTFQSCSSLSSNGGAVVSLGSSLVVSHCSFINCSAASGGAMSVSGPGSGLFLSVHNSNFTGNSARGGVISCPMDAIRPCSTWGGAVAVFGIFNVTISRCRMVSNSAKASVPVISEQSRKSSNAIVGGGCVSVLFPRNASGSSVLVSGNTFERCFAIVSGDDSVFVGNGACCWGVFMLVFLVAQSNPVQVSAERYLSTMASRPD